MSASIEWGHVSSVATYVLGHDEEAGDHQCVADDSDNPAEIGLMFGADDGYCLVGTPLELLTVLAQATAQVAERLGKDVVK